MIVKFFIKKDCGEDLVRFRDNNTWLELEKDNGLGKNDPSRKIIGSELTI